MQKLKLLVVTFLTSLGTLVAAPGLASATTSCSISGAAQASWGCGSVPLLSVAPGYTNVYDGYAARIQDTKTDGSCVYVYIRVVSNFSWVPTGDKECNEVATTVGKPFGSLPPFDQIRIYRFSSQGNNYLTIFQAPGVPL